MCVLADAAMSCFYLDCSLESSQNNIWYDKRGSSSFVIRSVNTGKTHTLSHNDGFGEAAVKLTVRTHFLFDMSS